jgi:hypothetical protein
LSCWPKHEAAAGSAGFSGRTAGCPLVPEVPYTAYTQFIGVTQHNLYHAGQIALLKRSGAQGRIRILGRMDEAVTNVDFFF